MRRNFIAVGLMLVLVLVGTSALAQTPTGAIRGVVTDPTGAVVPGASVKVSESATGRTIELKTNDIGLYTASLLLPGIYRVRIDASGFAPAEFQVELRAGQVVDADASLKLGTELAKVEVTDVTATLQVDTSRSTVDGVVTSQQIDRLPQNARNFLELAALQPGVLIRDGGSIDPTKEKAYRTVGVVGRSGTGTRVQIDGIDVTDETVGTTLSNISNDAVNEFQLTRSSLDLSTSLTSSGAVNIISRSGSNSFHGSAFYFFRNQDMGARLQFLPDKPPFERHQVGYRLGGPFIKDKLFWFSNWERTYQTEQSIYLSDANFPNIPFGSSNNCLGGCPGGVPLDIRLVNQRVDWNVRPNVRAFYRFSYDDNNVSGGDIPVNPFSNKDWTIVHAVGLDGTHGRFTHSYRFGYVNFNNKIFSQSFSGFEFPLTSQGTQYYLEVGRFRLGPNSLAPQQTYQDNFQNKYDGSFVFGRHTLRYGLEVNRIILGGFANFSGPLSIFGDFTSTTQAAVIARGANPEDPLEYPLSSFSTGPNNGFFTVAGCHGFDHGCHKNTRIAWYFGDTLRARKNLTLNFGTRWEYDSGYFNDESEITRPAYLDFYVKGAATTPKFPKDRFGPQFGFAWDPWSDGKTSIRGGGYVAYEMNIYNNILFDQMVLIPPGIGPDSFSEAHMALPDGSPITPAVAGITTLPASCTDQPGDAADLAGGDWSCLADPRNSLKSILSIIGQLDQTLKDAYATFQFDPTSGTPLLEIIESDFGHIIGGTAFKIPYSIQWNIGFQRELWRGNVVSVDFLYNHGVGNPFLGVDLECRRCANTLDVTVARAKRDSVLGGLTVDQWIAANPGKTISSFGLADDTIYTGLTPSPNAPAGFLQTTGLLRLRTMTSGGFSKYRGLHVQMRGDVRDKLKFIRHMNYTGSWAWGLAEATNASIRSEFLNTASNKFNPNQKDYFGPTGLDRRHIIAAGIVMDIPLGIRLGQSWTFRTAPPLNVFVPQLGLTSRHAIFSTDLNGDGNSGSGSPLSDVLPGAGLGQFGRNINSWSELNSIINAYNSSVAGQLTPAGQALVAAGLFTEAQLRTLKAVSPVIPLVPETNPWPFENVFNLNLSIGRPINMKFIREGFVVEPWVQIFNVFNHTGLNTYGGGLDGRFGSLNFDYADPADQADLTATRGRNADTRLFQVGVRVSF